MRDVTSGIDVINITYIVTTMNVAVFNNDFPTNVTNNLTSSSSTSFLPPTEQPSTSTSSLASSRTYLVALWLMTYVMPVIFSFGIVGNCVSFVVFLSEKMRRVSTNIYLAALSASNGVFLVAVAVTWTDVVGLKLIHTPVLCQATVYLTYCSGFLSVWLVVCITVENFVINFFLHKASTYCTVSRALSAVALLSVTALLLYDFAIWTTGLMSPADISGGGGGGGTAESGADVAVNGAAARSGSGGVLSDTVGSSVAGGASVFGGGENNNTNIHGHVSISTTPTTGVIGSAINSVIRSTGAGSSHGGSGRLATAGISGGIGVSDSITSALFDDYNYTTTSVETPFLTDRSVSSETSINDVATDALFRHRDNSSANILTKFTNNNNRNGNRTAAFGNDISNNYRNDSSHNYSSLTGTTTTTTSTEDSAQSSTMSQSNMYCNTFPDYQSVVEVFTVIDVFLTLIIPTVVILALVVPTCIKNITCSSRGETPARVMLSRKERALLRVTRLLCVIIVSFVVLTVPSNIIKLRQVFQNLAGGASDSATADKMLVVLICQVFYTLSFSMNFVYFLVWGKNFRERFCHLFVALCQMLNRCRRKFYVKARI